MLNRRLKHTLARWCVALLLLQAVVSAYACPGFLTVLDGKDSAAARPMPSDHPAGDAGQHGPNSGDAAVCHQHYSGEQWVDSWATQTVMGPPSWPILIVPTVERPAVAVPISSSLLDRQTGPPPSIRFQVFRI